ncbi:LacI family transcriptional regulator [Paenibacillus baekrokdamisoli]|uniref:LacI family transcriptional regulator n=1 Tax=Paenibacillus baekrokdamisoli TaxID=1712516 RepID=A0A3G9J2Z9_9BACL|nr:LacI family DNA-binding transcriptional regulator [Paenibacillus baekrokdamisoli]MBB3067734.1 LacI family transcriptional regulator [Paenibacillus baekrokdamisoli]BBH19083.1 LacI family transcriptional regulator [Paenibacillus baekrokdamisoli]
MVTIYDIAEKANVSAMTVSRVINNTGKISDKTRAKVKKVMEELHYVPNHTARSLVLQQTRVLFLLITDITNPFYTTLSRGAEDAAKKSDYRLLFGNSDESLEKESDYLTTILSSRVDGVLIAPAGDPSFPHLDSLRKHNVPFVLLDREVPGIECDIVLGDSKEGARSLVDYLMSQGHRRIAMINGSSSISSARLRLQGYQEALKLNDLIYDEAYVHEASFGPQSDLAQIEQWLDSMEPMPTAIMAGNNVLAIEVIRLLRKRGLRIPEDQSIVCIDDFGPYSEMDPFMTVAAQQAYQFGYLGMQMLIERIQERNIAVPWKKIVLPAELIIRRSVLPISE